MYSLLIYSIFLIIFLFAFMYQRTTLTIARIIQNLPITEVQMILTPTWIGLIGWISYGMYVACILIGFEFGWTFGILSFIFAYILSVIIPIPSSFFFNMIKDHLDNEIKNCKNKEKARIFEDFENKVKDIRKEYKIV